MLRAVILLTGRAGSKSVLRKNVHPVLGRPLAWYAMHAARASQRAQAIYVSTDCPHIQALAREMDISVIDRPGALAQDHSELVDAVQHALATIPGPVDILVTMHCNCGVHRPGLVDELIATLEAQPEADSCVSGYIDHSVHPFRTKRIGADGHLRPWLEAPPTTSSNRQQLEPCFVLDGAARALRVARCFPPNGYPPFAYLGRVILPVVNASGGDVHSLADIRSTESRLQELGWTAEPEPPRNEDSPA